MKKRAIIISAAAAVLIVVALLIKSFSDSRVPATIVLPTPASQSETVNGEIGGNVIDVTPETACTTLATLSRMESYSRTYTVTTYWQGGEAEDTLSVWQKGSSIRMSLDHAGAVKNLLILGSDLYIWYDGGIGRSQSTYYKDFDYADTDRFARLLTYEELYSLETEAITDAGYVQQLGEPCIYVEYTGYNNYVNRIHVSVNSGLLVSAEIYDGEALIYSMQSKTTELSTPSDDIFVPPLDIAR